jgi:hypothetical protein
MAAKMTISFPPRSVKVLPETALSKTRAHRQADFSHSRVRFVPLDFIHNGYTDRNYVAPLLRSNRIAFGLPPPRRDVPRQLARHRRYLRHSE